MDRAVEGRIGPLELLVLRELRQVLDVRVKLQRDVLLLAKLFKGQVQGDLERGVDQLLKGTIRVGHHFLCTKKYFVS